MKRSRTNDVGLLEGLVLIAASDDGPTLAHENVVLIPDGEVRLAGGDTVHVDAEGAKMILDAFSKQRVDFVVDYDHATLGGKYAHPNGLAPAAGWVSGLKYTPGAGIVANQIKWTNKAAAAVHDAEYRYLSPVVVFDKRTGRVEKLHSAGLTNKPAIEGMPALRAASDRILEEFTMPKKKTVKTDQEKIVRALQEELEGDAAPAADQVAMMIGELAGALKAAGVTIEEGAGAEAIIKAATEHISGSGGGEDEGQAGEAAASLAKLFKLKGEPDFKAIVAAAERVVVGGDNDASKALKAANERIESLEKTEQERAVAAAVAHWVDEGKLNEEDADRMEWAAASAARNIDDFNSLMEGAPVIIPQGARSATKVTQVSGSRKDVIRRACSEYTERPNAYQRLSSLKAAVAGALRDHELSALTDDEIKAL